MKKYENYFPEDFMNKISHIRLLRNVLFLLPHFRIGFFHLYEEAGLTSVYKHQFVYFNYRVWQW